MFQDDGSSPPLEPHADLLADLTDAQRDAVTHPQGPLLVLAAAGSGKTRVIARRIAFLVRARAVPAHHVLALTFTNKAAGEMRRRVESLLGEGVRGLTTGTFHALGARLLRRYAALRRVPALDPAFAICDAADQTAIVKRALADLNLSAANFPPRSVLAAIGAAKNRLIDAAAYSASAADFHSRTVARVFTAYERALRQANAVDFDDLLLLTARLLRDDPDARRDCRDRWRWILIDEYQDTNRAQFDMVSLLADDAPPGPNLCVVGDPDQAIYGWRGADIGNILDFERSFPRTRVIALGENFRSTAPILAAADALIRRNLRRRHKDLFTRALGGDPVRFLLCRDEHDEAARVVDWVRALCDDGLTFGDVAVCYRANALSRVLEEHLRHAAFPYVVARGTAYYEREEVRHALGYLRLVANPADDVSFERIVNAPARGLGRATLDRLRAAAGDRPMLDALRRAPRVAGLTPRARSAAAAFVSLVDAWIAESADPAATLSGLVERVVRESGLEAMYREQARATASETDADRLDNLAELVSSARQFEDEWDVDPAEHADVPPVAALLRAFLESIALVSDADRVDPARGAVTLLTLHAAKGLEFPAVAIVGLEEGLLPHARSLDADDALEEERRLCFVGMTRAMRRLLLTCARTRTTRGFAERTIASRFVGELEGVIQRESRVDDADPVGFDGSLAGALADGSPRARPRPAPGRGSDDVALAPGTRVRHPRFGTGTVVACEAGGNPRARIRFRDAGEKTLVLAYAPLERL
jgi:DNA helicase-2/ATP-dependent DNA helicase PcrA